MYSCSFFTAQKEPAVQNNTLTYSISDLDGQIVTSNDNLFQDKLVFITLWGTWCPPCLTEIPTFNSLQKKYNDEGLIIIGIAFERIEDADDRRKHLKKFAERYDISYTILDGGAIKDFGNTLPAIRDVEGFPVEILIDRSGTVVDTRNGYGYSEKWAAELESRIKIEMAKE